jgi:5'-nucleotidase
MRAALAGDADGSVRYEDLFATQPFSNALVTITLSGAQLLQALEQQWLGQARPRLLQVSRGLSYTWDAARPVGQRIVPGSLQLDGIAIATEQRLRVTVNAYLASGGDNFTALAENGSNAHTGMMDIDALEQYFRRAGTVSPGAPARIRRRN